MNVGSIVTTPRNLILIIAVIATGALFAVTTSSYRPPIPDPATEVINALPAAQAEAMRRELKDKKLALASITTYDENNATEGLEGMFQADFADVSTYRLYSTRVSNLDDLFNGLRDYSAVRKVDALIVALHANLMGIQLNAREVITSRNVAGLFGHYDTVFSKGAVVLLYSCLAGADGTSLARHLSATLHVDVVAPKFALIPETDAQPGRRTGEFGPDENGRLSFAFEHFRFYRTLWFKGRQYTDVMATAAYESAQSPAAEHPSGKDLFLIISQ